MAKYKKENFEMANANNDVLLFFPGRIIFTSTNWPGLAAIVPERCEAQFASV
jgi:hypothetical protein